MNMNGPVGTFIAQHLSSPGLNHFEPEAPASLETSYQLPRARAMLYQAELQAHI